MWSSNRKRKKLERDMSVLAPLSYLDIWRLGGIWLIALLYTMRIACTVFQIGVRGGKEREREREREGHQENNDDTLKVQTGHCFQRVSCMIKTLDLERRISAIQLSNYSALFFFGHSWLFNLKGYTEYYTAETDAVQKSFLSVKNGC